MFTLYIFNPLIRYCCAGGNTIHCALLISTPSGHNTVCLQSIRRPAKCYDRHSLKTIICVTYPSRYTRFLFNIEQQSNSQAEAKLKLTIANPDNRAEVRLVAFNLARLKYSFLHDRACIECSLKLIPKVLPSGQSSCYWSETVV